MLVNLAVAGDWTVHSQSRRWDRFQTRIAQGAANVLRSFLQTSNVIVHSPAVFSSNWVSVLNASDVDIVHLHWVGAEMLSIKDIGEINKPIVWTLHDMWAFCGAEHYTEDFRWREGYRSDNRPPYESGFDLNRWTWNRKRKYWRKEIFIHATSGWLGKCANESALMRDWPVTVIPYPLDTGSWFPIDKGQARTLLGLPADLPVVLFGALGGGNDPRKGFDLLQTALECLRASHVDKSLQLLVFGQLAPRRPPDIGFPIKYAGYLHDDISLQVIYSAADVIVVPSRQEAFGQTASEAQACGTPVVAFNIGGLPDIVEHCYTGYLAEAFNIRDLANGILWVLDNPFIKNKDGKWESIRKITRDNAKSKFSHEIVGTQYRKFYENVLQK